MVQTLLTHNADLTVANDEVRGRNTGPMLRSLPASVPACGARALNCCILSNQLSVATDYELALLIATMFLWVTLLSGFQFCDACAFKLIMYAQI